MPTQAASSDSLVSVIVTGYNHGHFLAEAIDSVLRQTWSAIEVIMVDDGSLDNTRAVAGQYTGIQYHYQSNQGLSAARNAGVRLSKGEFIVFLDADDWLYSEAISVGLQYLRQNPPAVFSSGAYNVVDVSNRVTHPGGIVVENDHYLRMLEGNYIGMHATVMYRRTVFDSYSFDTSLTACEDYDLYLRITRQHPVVHHTHKIAAYREHSSNMSKNSAMMLAATHYVLSGQKDTLRTMTERRAYRKGHQFWTTLYATQVYIQLCCSKRDALKLIGKENLTLLKKYRLDLYLRYLLKRTLLISALRKAKTYAPTFALRWLHQAGAYDTFNPVPGQVRLGDLKRDKPFSTNFGHDRGGPIDRYYIEFFLQQQHAGIRGRVLEIGDNEYTLRFGGTLVTKSDVLHVHQGNPQATFVGDLSDAPHIPSDSFDCIILTQTLHLIYNIQGALKTCERILKPGGTLLLTVPGISHIDHDEWSQDWLWAFTSVSLHRLLLDTFTTDTVTINTHGNVFIATAFLYGMGISEVTRKQLDFHDPHYQVIVTAKVVKAQSV